MIFRSKILIAIMLASIACTDNSSTKSIRGEGEILWQTQSFGGNLESTPAIDDHSNIYVIGDGYLYSYTIGGEKRWAVNVSAVDFNAPSVSPDNSTVYCGGSDGLFAVKSEDGTVKWHASEFTAGFHSVPAVSRDGSRIYIGVGAERDEGDIFYCFNAEDGKVMWEYDMPHEAYGFRGYLGGAIISLDGTIYLTSQHGWLLSLTDNGDSYTENWGCRIGAEMRMPPSMDIAGYLYVGDSESGQIHKVDSGTGIEEGGNWPVSVNTQSNEMGEVFANIAIGNDGTIFANSEDERLWAINRDGTVKWNNIHFEVWGSDPLIRADGRIIVISQIEGAARVACIRDNESEGLIEWTSRRVSSTLMLNETNVNITPDGTIVVHSGDREPFALFAIQGNGHGLSTSSPWPKYMGNTKNNGNLNH